MSLFEERRDALRSSELALRRLQRVAVSTLARGLRKWEDTRASDDRVALLQGFFRERRFNGVANLPHPRCVPRYPDFDEADFRFSDERAEIAKILNNGNVSGLPVLRTMMNRQREFNPQAFQVFGPKIVATRGSYEDKGLESRFLTEEMGSRKLRSDIPINLPDSSRTKRASFATSSCSIAFIGGMRSSWTRAWSTED